MSRPEAIEPEPYDLVVCLEVLEHIVDYRRVVENIFRALRPGGRAIHHRPHDPKKWSVLDE